MQLKEDRPPESPSLGLVFAIGAYLSWGLLPIYWKRLQGFPATEILAHRIVWSFVLVLLVLVLARRLGQALRTLRSPRVLGALVLSTALVSSNWGIYIWAVNSGHVTQASLGYYLNPLLNVLLGRIVLGETLRPLPALAFALAVFGMAVLAFGQGELPLIAVSLAATFSLYGLVRKRAGVDPLTGLLAEVGLGAPLSLAFLLTRPARSGPLLGFEPGEAALLVGSGAVTAVPLVLFAASVTRLRYSTIGMVQYLAPTCQLGLAVLVYGEPFGRTHAVTLGFIWTAVFLYAFDGARVALAARRAAA